MPKARPYLTPESEPELRVIFADILRSRSVASPTGCTVWVGTRTGEGYGTVRFRGRAYSTHRMAYELARGPIAPDFVIDHLCHTQDPQCPGGPSCEHRACLDPNHLEPVTDQENARRGGNRLARCSRGHAWDAVNTYWSPDGYRHCRACNRIAARESKQRRAFAAANVPSTDVAA